MTAIARLTPGERAVFAEHASATDTKIRSDGGFPIHTPREPAMGTLDERLGIIIRRLGGRTAPVNATRAEVAEYDLWLSENNL